MRTALTKVVVTAAAFAAPMLASGSAHAADSTITIPQAAIVVADVGDLAIPRGCTLTYLGRVLSAPAEPVVTTPPGKVVVNYDIAVNYVVAVTSHTVSYISCL